MRNKRWGEALAFVIFAETFFKKWDQVIDVGAYWSGLRHWNIEDRKVSYCVNLWRSFMKKFYEEVLLSSFLLRVSLSQEISPGWVVPCIGYEYRVWVA